jgi:hypothetical protein
MRRPALLALAGLALLAVPATADAHSVTCPSPLADPAGHALCWADCWQPFHLASDLLNGQDWGCPVF